MDRIARLVAVLALAVALAACADDAPSSTPGGVHPATLAGTSWTVVAINGIATPRGAQPTMEFSDGQVRGSAPCNHYGGNYRYDPPTGELRLDGLGMTAMACAEAARNRVEAAFTQALGQPVLVAMLQPEGRLVLAGPVGSRLDLVSGLAIVD